MDLLITENKIDKESNKMTKIDIISGFLGAGKTTFIKKMIEEAFKGEQIVLIENEFGEVGIDGGFLKDAGITINEMNSGCICCSLVGDFAKNLNEVITTYHPDRILIEPSGVGKLSDVMKSVIDIEKEQEVKLNALVTVVNSLKAMKQMKAFGEFFNDQIAHATTVVLSRTQNATPEQLEFCTTQIQALNPKAKVITTPWDNLSGAAILNAIEGIDNLEMKLLAEQHHAEEEAEHEHEHHHHHDDDDDDEHEHHHCHHHDDDDDDECPECHQHGHHCHCHDGNHQHGDEYGISTFVYFRRGAFNRDKFITWASAQWKRNIIRCKGVVYFSDEYDMSYMFEQAGTQKNLQQSGLWIASAPEEEKRNILEDNPDLLREWDDEYGDRMEKLVFIGQKMDKEEIIKALDKCLA